MERKIIAKWVMAPDGTMLPSFYNWDYRVHKTPDGRVTSVDGGTNPVYSSNSNWNVTDMTVYSDDPFEVRRRFFCRQNKGPEGTAPPTWVPVFRMNDQWLDNVIIYLNGNGINESIYHEERAYRNNNSIKIEENE